MNATHTAVLEIADGPSIVPGGPMRLGEQGGRPDDRIAWVDRLTIWPLGRIGDDEIEADCPVLYVESSEDPEPYQAALTGAGWTVIGRDGDDWLVSRSSDLLDLVAVAAMLGVTYDSARVYRARGNLPEPDVMLGNSPGWHLATIEAWQAQRPGRTGRPRKS